MQRLHHWLRHSAIGLLFLQTTLVQAQETSAWKVQPLTLDANEGCAIGDIDGNGSPDLVAGRNWYPAPDFVGRPLRIIEDWNGYVQSNGDFLFDMNGDGRLDVVAGSFVPTEVYWYENPGAEPLRLGQTWPSTCWSIPKSVRTKLNCSQTSMVTVVLNGSSTVGIRRTRSRSGDLSRSRKQIRSQPVTRSSRWSLRR